MTLFYPDISDYEHGISLAGMSAVVVKATEGTTWTSSDYDRVAGEATTRGIPWAAYHFLRHDSDPVAQARHFHDVAGNTPMMIDIETEGASKPTEADVLSFTAELTRLGGRPRLAYLPHWYWQTIGSPDLTPLASAGLHLVSSNYTTYSDTGPGWAAYGGVSPTVWQYTDAHEIDGFACDFNAYRGSAEDFRALLNGGTQDMGQFRPFIAAREAGKTAVTDIVIGNSLVRRRVRSAADWQSLQNAWWWNLGGGDMQPGVSLTVAEGWVAGTTDSLGVDLDALAAGGVDTNALGAALTPSLPTAAAAATHIDLDVLAAKIASHFSVK